MKFAWDIDPAITLGLRRRDDQQPPQQQRAAISRLFHRNAFKDR
ncbi:MAG: hypothetical protein ACN6QY_22085 [Pseudomonas sp.]